MLSVQTFIWLTLMGITPDLTLLRKSVLGLLGIVAALALYASTVILFETFQLAPHKGLLKLFVILLPFVVYVGCFLSSKEACQSQKEATPAN